MTKRIVKKILRRFGFELRRYRVSSSEAARLQRLLTYHEIDVVLDVGANRGQFAESIRDCGYKGRIVSFEPLAEAHRVLLGRSRNDKKWSIAPRMALGRERGELSINVSQNSVSSSAREMLASHIEAAPTSRYVGVERVRLERLDRAATPYLEGATSVYLKIDTQGYEAEILDGAATIFPRIKGIQVELSLVSLYEDQLLLIDMAQKLAGMGFELWGIVPDFTDPESGRLLQADGIFFRKA